MSLPAKGTVASSTRPFDDVHLCDAGPVIRLFARHREQWQILREDANDHRGFGHGEHDCVGKDLARLEMRAALTQPLPCVARFGLIMTEPLLNNTLHGLAPCRVTVH